MNLILENEIYKYKAVEFVKIACSGCKKIEEKKVNSIRVNVKRNGKYLCHKCKVKTPDYREKQKKNHDKMRTGRKWDNKVDVKCSICGKEDKINYRSNKFLERKNKEYRCMSCVNRKNHADGKYKKIYTKEFKNKLAIARSNIPKVSKPQKIFYSILDDLGIKYHREYNNKPDDPQCKIAEYSFDCVIPRKNDKDLLIDVNGDWVHSQSHVKRNDKAKATYIERYFSHLYELKYVWEHELACYNKIIEIVKYWMGITKLELIDFNFKDVEIKKSKSEDYKLLLSKYHYLPNAGRGGISYGAYLGDELVAVCVFSPLIRQNIALPSGFNKDNSRELSRFCIHPRYQKKNFASWFMSKCIRKLSSKYKLVISYADTTFGHSGTIYRACGFKQDRIVRPDYWYTSKINHVMHKRTLYGRAKDLKITESQFASQFGYNKIYGKEKFRYIYKR